MGVHARDLPGAAAEASPDRHAGPALLRRLGFGLAGEGAQSAFHFGLNLALLRSLPAYDYGLFAIIFAGGSVALTYANALAATPVSVVLPRLRRGKAADRHDAVFRTAAFLSSLVLALVAGLGLALWTAIPWVAPAGAAFVGLWSLRHYVRAALFARREPQHAAAGDAAFAVTGLVLAGLAVATAAPQHLLAAALLALAAANAAGIAVGLAAARRPVWLAADRRGWRHYRQHRSMVSWALVGVTTSNLQAQVQTILVAALIGPAAFAPIAAGLVLTAPLRIAVAALIGIVRPDFAEALAAGRTRPARRLLLVAALLVVAGSLAYGALLWAGWQLLRLHLFGASLAGEPMGLIAVLSWAIAFVYLAYFLPEALLEAAGRFRAVALATLASAVVGTLAVAVLLVVAAPAWSLLGVIAAEAVTLVWFWSAALRLLARSS